jgi:hypothetical protein
MERDEIRFEIEVEFPAGKKTSQVFEVPGNCPEEGKSLEELLDPIGRPGISPRRDEHPGVVPVEITIFVGPFDFLQRSGNMVNVIPYAGQGEEQGNRIDGDLHYLSFPAADYEPQRR